MKRTASSFLVSLLALVVLVGPAGAGKGWCKADPIISLNGSQVQMWVAIPEEYEEHVTGPINVVIGVPAGVDYALLFTDDGFNGHGETVSFVEGGSISADGQTITATAFFSVPLSVDYYIPMQVEVIPESGSPVYLYGENVGLTVTFNLSGGELTGGTSATGASANGESTNGESTTAASSNGSSANGASATGASATGASATGASARGASATGSSSSSNG